MEQGQKFRLIRKQRHLTIKQLAEVASSVASISDFENGKTSLSNDNLFKLLRYLRVEYNEFFDNDLLLDKSFQELANDFNKAMFEKDVASLEKCCHAFEQLGNNNPIDKIISFLLIFGQMWILVCWIWLKQFLM
ncbi:helix-turn-helix domain-containing protein [Streptococcus orisratti]|uniref:helix-turn-helix domain-containing protein n=1 Tax=Streptococcus orisratti TaxID=114652 RepID=UPI003D026A1F